MITWIERIQQETKIANKYEYEMLNVITTNSNIPSFTQISKTPENSMFINANHNNNNNMTYMIINTVGCKLP